MPKRKNFESHPRRKSLLYVRDSAFRCDEVFRLKVMAVNDVLSFYQKAKYTKHLETCARCGELFSQEELHRARLWLRTAVTRQKEDAHEISS